MITVRETIHMVDLQSQYLRLREEIDAAVLQVMQDARYINGPEVGEFAQELADYLGCSNVIPCANGTDALQIALMALDPEPGDEVIVPAFTYIATVEVIALLRLKPVFIDVDPDTFQLDTDQLLSLITSRTKAIVPVHLYGQCANMEHIMQVARSHGLSVIEDNAQAIGARYIFSDGTAQAAGTIGTIGTTSFFPSKNLGCYGDGGAMMTNDLALAGRLNMIANHGQSKKYYHDCVGVNSRLDTVQAAVLRVKLKYLAGFTASRNAVADRYDAALGDLDGLSIPKRVSWSDHVFHQYTIKVHRTHRDSLRDHLASHGIPTMIYYPVPVHLQQGYKEYGYKRGDFPVSEALCDQVISLPIHTEMPDDVQDFIIQKVKAYFRG